jgi:hypothetical protein
MPNQIGVPAPPAVGDVEDGAIDQAHLAYRICVPARNEADRIGTLLDALAEQDIAGPIPIVIGLNNTTDSSAGVISACRRRHAARLDIRVDEHLFPIECAHAGSARRRVMDIGLAWLGEKDGVLVTTDADARPPEDWVSQNLRAIRDGADIVGGYLLIDDAEPLGSEAEAYSRLWHLYWAKVRAIEDEIDPRHWDPPPRHGDHTGASLALTARIYKAAGGVPVIPSGEDRALVGAAIAAGGKLAHPMSVWTRVSPRLEGRATGGMAQAMVELHDAVDKGRPIMAPALAHWRERAVWRRKMRDRAIPEATVLDQESRLPTMPQDMRLSDIVGEP